ncbi:hypothetical protein RHMOL_Rhmol06G0284400 [Rhododendron molle]|uniref:Uncharacterized protein n=1 Tax=Rhododendron molle TaxID=49168 RepID=A0ACC0NJA0_RHOML|nr:hypothetical protein RHMOL_Rhmol06G0284400 [Rhododendron molle]
MGDHNPLGNIKIRIPTLPGEEGWVLYHQLKEEVCTMMRRLHATRDAIQVCDQILAQKPELPLMNYISEKIGQYMASESAWEEEYLAKDSAMDQAMVHNTTNDLANMVLDGH